MDLNDPKRRLQVLQSSSPSLRVATQPRQQQISIAQPATQQLKINVPKAAPVQQSQYNPAQPNKFKAIQLDKGKNKTIFGKNAAWLLPKRYEKKYGVGTKDVDFANKDAFLKYFDSRGKDFRNEFVNKIRKQAFGVDEQGKPFVNDAVAYNTFKTLQDSGRFKGDFGDFMSGANDKLFGGLSRGALRGVDLVLPGVNTFGLEQEADRQEAPAQFTSFGRAGETVGSVEKGIVDIASMFAGAGAADKVASKIPALTKFLDTLSKGGTISKTTAKALGILPGSLAASGIDVAQTAGRGDSQNIAKSFGIGTAIDLALPTLGKGLKKGYNLFRGKGSKSVNVIEDLIRETNPENIKRVFGVDDNMASYLAQETNPSTVREILKDISIDPNIKLTDDVVKRLEDEGITSVRQGDTDFGAEYKDGKIKFQDQSNADKNVYHELGHHLYNNKLTPDEKALFKGTGDASQSSVGRKGYTQADINSEDFSDYLNKASNGKISEVPDEFQDVIRKYAQIADSEADNIGLKLNKGDPPKTDFIPESKASGNADLGKTFAPIDDTTNTKMTDLIKRSDATPVPDGHTRLYQTTDGVNSKSDQYFKDREQLTNYINGRADNAKLEFKDVPDAQVKETPGKPDVYKISEDVTAAQTGTSDPAVKTTSTDAPQSDFTTQNGVDTGNAGNALKSADNGSQGVLPQKASDIVPNGDQSTQKAVQDVLDSLNSAEKTYGDVAKVRTKELGSKIKKGGNAFEAAGGGEAGVRAKLKALSGKQPQSKFDPVKVSEPNQKAILDDIEQSDMLDFQKLNTQQSMRKLWGSVDDKPAPHDIKKIRDYFETKGEGLGEVVEKQIKEAIDSGETLDMVEQIVGAPRTLMTVGDASAPRQLAVSFARHPAKTTKAYLGSLPDMFSNKRFTKKTKALENMADSKGVNYSEFMSSKMNMHLPNVAEMVAEEGMSSTPLLSKIPVVGKVVEGSNRGMSSAVAHTRFNIAKKFVDDAGGIEEANRLFSKKELTDLGEVINTITGRGGKKGGLTEVHGKILSKTLFSGKLWASRMNMLNPYWYYRLSGPARKEAMSSAASFAASAGVVLTAISQMPGTEVGTDPTSADFAKIKVGNTRFDILGGFQQNIRVAAQIATGKRTSSQSGETKDVTASSVIGGLIEGKANPLLGFAYKTANTLDDPDSDNPFQRLDEWGESRNTLAEAGNLLVPLPISGVKETVDDQGATKGVLYSLPGFFGASVQTYGSVKTKDQGKDSTGKIVFKGKVTDNMVLDDGGEPILDDRGRPIKVKFPDDASDLEKEALLDDKRQSALSRQYKDNLSREDQTLMKLTQDQLKDYVADGKINQDKYNEIQQNFQDIRNLSGVDVPEGVTSSLARTYYKNYNSKSKQAQEDYLNAKPDQTAKTIARLLNKDRVEGLSEFKASNRLSKAYAEYEADINSHPEYTKIDLQNKAKSFQKFSYKLNYSDDQRDVYTEGSSSDLRTLINDGQIDQDDLDEAIKLDNELYNSQLSGSLKFSKKFRREYGYGLPTKYASRTGSSGKGKAAKTQRAYLSALLPSSSTGGGSSGAPKFSSKRRTKGITFGSVNKPRKTGKKITIKL